MTSTSNYATVAQALYVAYFGRPADVQGLSDLEATLATLDTVGAATTPAGLVAEYANNSAIKAMVDAFGTSTESMTLYGTNVANFVTAVFESLFNRAPAASGLLFWENAIQTSATTLGAAALNILADASTADAATVAAKVFVASQFTTAMEGSAAAINAYQGQGAASAARSLLQGVTTVNATQAAATVVAVASGNAGLGINPGTSTGFTSTGTGTDIVQITPSTSSTTSTITANGSTQELLVSNGATASVATIYLGAVTGFKVLGIGSDVAATSSQIFDLSKAPSFSGFDIQSNSTTNTIELSNVASGSPLSIDGAFAGTLVYATADTVGPTDSVALTLGAVANQTGFTVAGLTLEDNAHFGIGTVSVITNAATTAAVGINTIINFQDASLTTLNVSGTGSLTISNNLATSATSLTVAAASGTGATSALTGTVTFGGGITDTHLTTLNLSGTDNISFGTITDGTSGITVSGASDNANISLALAGVTATGHTDSITLGNGNNVVTDTAAAAGAIVNITLGNGNNTVTLGTGTNNVIEAAGGNVAVTFGTHGISTIDNVTVGAATDATIAPSAVITGFNVAATGSDTITFSGDAGATGAIVTYTTAQIDTFGSNPASLATAVAGVLSASGGDLAQHSVGEFTFQGNTYFVEQAGATGSAFAAGDTVVELTGNQTITTGVTTVAAGVLHLHG